MKRKDFIKDLKESYAKRKGISQTETWFPHPTLELIADIIWKKYNINVPSNSKLHKQS